MRDAVSQEGLDFAHWTPDLIPAAGSALAPRQRGKSEASSPPDLDSIVRETAEVVWEEACERERELIRAAVEERDRLIAEAYAEGFEEGRHEGEIAEAARLRTAVEAATEALDELRAGEVRWTGTIEENVCALAVAIARQVVGRELATDIEPVIELVRRALSEFPIDQPIRIRINPADLNAMRSADAVEGDRLGAIAPDRDAGWQPDPAIAPGGVVVEGRERIIDGRVDTALERVYRRLTYTNA
jgi:flagellar assembly protein FliH